MRNDDDDEEGIRNNREKNYKRYFSKHWRVHERRPTRRMKDNYWWEWWAGLCMEESELALLYAMPQQNTLLCFFHSFPLWRERHYTLTKHCSLMYGLASEGNHSNSHRIDRDSSSSMFESMICDSIAQVFSSSDSLSSCFGWFFLASPLSFVI